MHQKSITAGYVNKVKITFTRRGMSAYGGFALIAAFFKQIDFAEMIKEALPVAESSPNGMGIYGKIVAYAAMVYAGAERFSHLVYLGNRDILATLFGAARLPAAATTLTRLFTKIKNFTSADTLSQNVWDYLSRLIPWESLREDWLTFDSSVLPRYGT